MGGFAGAVGDLVKRHWCRLRSPHIGLLRLRRFGEILFDEALCAKARVVSAIRRLSEAIENSFLFSFVGFLVFI